ncbi:MAG TPA: hypothetical protein VFU47_15280 [Armatimonadota bacterium]|nr:hypothetical protein [Armatimonadota bacterium]
MKGSDRTETDRYYRASRRVVALSLAFAVSLSAFFLADVLGYLDGRAGSVGLIIGAIYLASVVALKIKTSGARLWGRRDPLLRAIFRDEWSWATRNRASRTALMATLLLQVPLAIFMANVPPEPSVVGMGALTMSLGLAAFFGAYLYYGRQPGDG